MMAHCYYIPSMKAVFPPNTTPDLVAFLFATYIRHMDPACDEQNLSPYDGSSIQTDLTSLETKVMLVRGRECIIIEGASSVKPDFRTCATVPAVPAAKKATPPLPIQEPETKEQEQKEPT